MCGRINQVILNKGRKKVEITMNNVTVKSIPIKNAKINVSKRTKKYNV